MYSHANTKFAAVGSNTTWSRVTVRSLFFSAMTVAEVLEDARFSEAISNVHSKVKDLK